jgi:chloride channel protein, CIC family
MASYPVNVPAGIFSPLLAIGTTVGLIGSGLLEAMLEHTDIATPPLLGAAFAVTAMGGLFSATIRAPLVGVVLLVELTGAFELILPLMVTCVTAHVVAEALGGRPIYEVLLERTLRLAGQVPKPRAEGMSSPVGIDQDPRGPQ